MTKEKQQLVALGAMGIIFIGVAGYYFRDKFMPIPDGRVQLPAAVRLELPKNEDYKKLFSRKDFQTLQPLSDRPISIVEGNPPAEIFVKSTE